MTEKPLARVIGETENALRALLVAQLEPEGLTYEDWVALADEMTDARIVALRERIRATAAPLFAGLDPDEVAATRRVLDAVAVRARAAMSR